MKKSFSSLCEHILHHKEQGKETEDTTSRRHSGSEDSTDEAFVVQGLGKQFESTEGVLFGKMVLFLGSNINGEEEGRKILHTGKYAMPFRHCLTTRRGGICEQLEQTIHHGDTSLTRLRDILMPVMNMEGQIMISQA